MFEDVTVTKWALVIGLGIACFVIGAVVILTREKKPQDFRGVDYERLARQQRRADEQRAWREAHGRRRAS